MPGLEKALSTVRGRRYNYMLPMKNRSIFTCIILLCFCAAPSFATRDSVKVTAEGFTKVYKGPSRSASVIAFARKGEIYPLLWQGGDWVKIGYEEVEGWMQKRHLALKSPSSPEPAPTASGTQKPSTEPPVSTSSAQRTTSMPPDTIPASPQMTPKRQSSAPDKEPEKSPPPAPRSTARYSSGSAKSPEGRKPVRGASPEKPSRSSQQAVQPADTAGAQKTAPAQKDTVHIFVSHPSVPVLARPDTAAHIIGMAVERKPYAVLNQTSQWIRIDFNNGAGWIERRYVMPPAVDETGSPQLPLILGALIILVAGSLLVLWRLLSSRGKKRYRVLLIARKDKRIDDAITDGRTTVIASLKNPLFAVHNARDLHAVAKYLQKKRPDVIIVDWEFGSRIAERMKSALTSRTALVSLPVILYNVVNTERARKTLDMQTFYYLGNSFTVQDLFKFALLLTGDRNGSGSFQKSIQRYALEGPIEQGSLSEVLQLIEVGNKTGGLLVDHGDLFGAIYFQNGIITYAVTKTSQGMQAIEELLDLTTGYFRLSADVDLNRSNCSVRIAAALMEWAQKKDEQQR
jgi:uncharacterized protein YraI